jgi:urease accessory protein
MPLRPGTINITTTLTRFVTGIPTMAGPNMTGDERIARGGTRRTPVKGVELLSHEALYRLMIWLSPAYPVGAFAYSSGIEWSVEAGDITNA